MLKMGTVWDRAAEVLGGRAGMLASIAALTFWLPAIVRQAIGLALLGAVPGPPSPGIALGFALLSLVIGLLGLFGQLALVAVASDPATTRNDAFRQAANRLPAMVGLVIVLGLVLALAAVPIAVVAASHLTSLAAQSPDQMVAGMAAMSPGQRGFLGLYGVLLGVGLLWVYARLALLNPVVLNERHGIGSFARSLALTRGLTWRIIGVILLFGIVFLVVSSAVQFVGGVIITLLLGRGSAVGSLVLVALTAAVAAALSVVFAVFVAQLYVARREVAAP